MNPHQNILQNIKRYVDLKVEDENAFVAIIKRSRVKKRQFIVQPNFVCTHQTYIEKGTFRSYFLTDEGTEHYNLRLKIGLLVILRVIFIKNLLLYMWKHFKILLLTK